MSSSPCLSVMSGRLRCFFDGWARLAAALIFGLLAVGGTAQPSLAGDDTRVTWDKWGVPHIAAASEESLAYATGWAQMRANANAVLCVFAGARGRFSETACGSDPQQAVHQDRQMRRMGLSATAAAWLSRQSPEELRRLQAFSDGINAYAQSDPAEIGETQRAMLPVQPADVLARLAQLTLVTFSAPADEVEVEIAAWQQGEAMPVMLPQTRGSNAIAVAPAKSGEGTLLLANPHLPWKNTVRWFEFEASMPAASFYGAGMLGLPGHMIGYSDRLGWSHTVNQMHSRYFYELQLEGDGYRLDGKIRRFERREETIRILAPDGSFSTETVEVLDSVFGPVVATKGDRALALWVVGRDGGHMLAQYRDMAMAQDIAEFRVALERQQIPLFSVVYGDAAGHTAFFFGGRNPAGGPDDRRGDLVLDGTTQAALWRGILDQPALPHLIDPPSHWVQSANDPPWTATWPRILDPSDFPRGLARSAFVNLRAQRIIGYLQSKGTFGFDALVALKHDTRSELAERVLDDLIAAAAQANDPDTRLGGQVLQGWNRAMDADSGGAVLFFQWVMMAPDSDSLFATPFDVADPLAGPRGLANPADAAALLGEAVRRLRSIGVEPDLPWGAAFRLPDGATGANGGPDPFGLIRATYFDRQQGQPGFVASGGDGFCLVVSLGKVPRAEALLSYGNFTQPVPKGVNDQMPLYAAKQLRAVMREPIAAADAILTETLTVPVPR